MTNAFYSSDLPLTSGEKNRAIGAMLSAWAVWFGAFLSGFVISEPAPYELYMAALIPVWVVLGLRIPASIGPLIAMLLIFNLGGIMSMMMMPNWSSAVIYVAVSFFLALTAIFFASIIAAKPERLHILFNGYLIAAMITGLLGILGYFGALPGAEAFTRFGRAKGAFQDPNVFAPFLMLPAMWCLHNLLTRPMTRTLPFAGALMVLALALFLSFSRAGWGMLVICASLLTFMLLIANPSGRFRVRVIVLSAFAIVAMAILLLIALQFDAVSDLFSQRAQLVQDYDGARMGRFARHWLGLMMATEHPFGIGILQFGLLFGEDPHNVYLKALTDYAWLGFAAYMALIVVTLCAGLKFIFRDRPWQPFLMCAYVVFVGHVIIGYVIDTDHWRHFFLLLGIIWGCIAAEQLHGPNQKQANS